VSSAEFPGLHGLREVLPPDGGRAAGADAKGGAMLDKSDQNVPSRASAPAGRGRARFEWTGKHYRVRAACRDFLLWSERVGGNAFFLTLTSAPGHGGRDVLRRDFQAFRKRLARKLRLDVAQIAYCGVDTLEGHGVLHLLVSVPPGRGRSSRFLVSVEWLRDAWVEIHGAQQLRIVPIRKGGGSARRLSTYLVSQYVGGQDGLVRLSRSRIGLISAVARRAFYRLVFGNPRRWLGWAFYGGTPLVAMQAGVVTWGPQYAMLRGHWWREFRQGWESFVLTGRAVLFGREYVGTLAGGFEES